MPLKKGNTNIGAIYKGTTQIAKIYKGTTLLFENAKWLDYLFEHIYHSLIPTTISGKTVQDKAKLTKIEGNGVVENQIDFNGDFHTNDSSYYSATEPDYMSMSIANNVLTCSVIQTISSGTTGNLKIDMAYKGHKYLISTLVKSTVGNNTVRIGFSINNAVEYGDFLVNQGETKLLSGIYEPTTNNTTQIAIIRFQGGHSVGNTFESYYYEIIDLTLMFGTGNEPTTLTDNRIQALLNRGYIAYNTGSYKNSKVSEIEAKPYNLFDGELELGAYQYSDGAKTSNTNRVRNTNPISVVGGRTYKLEKGNANQLALFEYDENMVMISFNNEQTATSANYTLSNRTKFVNFFIFSNTDTEQKICFHITGTRTGYAPYQAPTKITLNGLLELNGAINSHDTFEITNVGYVFTRNAIVLDLGDATWEQNSTQGFYTLNYTSVVKANTQNYLITTPKYHKGTGQWTDQNSMWVGSSSAIGIADQDFNSGTDFKNYLTTNNIKMVCELATPQVITIPKKHLGCIDLGKLTYTMLGSGQTAYFRGYITDLNTPQAKGGSSSVLSNIYCNRYGVSYRNDIVYSDSNVPNNLISLEYASDMGTTSVIVYIRDLSYTNTADLKSSLAGQYLFYETDAEVSDFDNIAQINAGGSITSNWFSWNKNQLVQNGDFEDNTGWSVDLNSTATFSGGKVLITVQTGGYGSGLSYATNNYAISGHKYLMVTKCKSSDSAVGIRFSQYSYGAGATVLNSGKIGIGTTEKIMAVISTASATASGSTNWRIACIRTNGTSVVDDTLELDYAEIIDLTLAFGAGNEPTSENDPRIQYIINKGFIPQDTIETEESVAPEVLPNVNFKFKCK